MNRSSLLLGILGLVMPLLSASASAQDRFSESVSTIKDEVSTLQFLVKAQKDCLSALRSNGDWRGPCAIGAQGFFAEVVQKDMSLYLDALGEAAVQKNDSRYLDLANDFYFYTKQARDLNDQIWSTASDDQNREMLKLGN